MTCVICKHGQTQAGQTTVTLERGGTTLVYKGVPARVCDNCGEAYVDEAVASRLLAEAQRDAQADAELKVHRYAAA